MGLLSKLRPSGARKATSRIGSSVRGTAFENMSQLATRPITTTPPKDRKSFTNLDLYQFYEWLQLIKEGIEKLVNAMYARNMEPPLKPHILLELIKKDIQKRIPGWSVVVKESEGRIKALAAYHDKIGSGVKPTPTIYNNDGEQIGGGINLKTGIPNSFDVYVDGVLIKTITKFVVCTNFTIHNSWRGSIEMLPVIDDAVLLDKMVEMYANYCVINALGFIFALCKDQPGKKAVLADLAKTPSTLRAYAALREHVESIEWIGPSGSTFDPLPMIMSMKSDIRRHFSLDKLDGEGSGSTGQVSEADFYSKVIEAQVRTLPENIEILEMAGSLDSIFADYPGMERKREKITSHDQIRFPDPHESSLAQMMVQINMLIQAGAIQGIDPETVVEEICSITGWSLDFSKEYYDKMMDADQSQEDNETNRAIGDAKPNIDNKAKAKPKSREKVGSNT